MSTPVILSSTPSVILNGAERSEESKTVDRHIRYILANQSRMLYLESENPTWVALTPDIPRFPTPPYTQYPIRMESRKRTQKRPPRRRGAPNRQPERPNPRLLLIPHQRRKIRTSLPDAVHLKGLQGEIGLLRLKIRRLASYPDSPPDLLFRAINTLVRAIEVNEIINNIRR